jgi:quinoprotein glucose dehydrogenase
MKPSVAATRLAVVLLAGASVVSAQTLELEPFERLPTPIVDPASDDARNALQRFTLPAGLEATLWAAEPMLANPVAIDFDEKGRLFVSETHRYRSSVLDIRGYMGMLELDMAARTIDDRMKLHRTVFGEAGARQLSIEGEIVRLVEDKDGDGVADSSRVYSDGYNHELDGIASGVLARHGKVWFTNIPSLWLLEDNGDDKAKKTELLRGFGVRYNFTGHDFHGLALGHDGKLYYSIGDRGTHVKGKEGQVVDYPDEGAVFRSNPDGTEFELFARGLRNPQELVFDEHGNLFTGDNDSDQADQERLVYLVEGGDSGWRVGYQHPPMGRGGPWIREGLWKPSFKDRPAYLLPPVCNIEDGPSGLTYYPGTGLTPAYKGHFFITHFKGSIARSGIQTYTIEENGATFKATSSQAFMGGVLPTDVTFGPDGVLYLSDWVDGWPKSQKGRIYGIKAANPDPAHAAQSAELAKLLAGGFKDKDDRTLAGLLSHEDRRARLEAQLELASRGDGSVAVFRKVANDVNAAPLARLHAIWGLTQLGRKNAKIGPMLVSLSRDKAAEVRAQAVKGLGDIGFAKARPMLEKALTDAAPRVQFFAAQSLGKLEDAKSVPALIDLLRRNDDKDAYLRHAASFALSRIGKNGALDSAARHESAAVRLGVLLTYRQLGDPAIGQFVNDASAFVAREAAEAINDAPVVGAYPALAGKLGSAPAKDEAFVARAINAHYRLGTPENARTLAQYAVRSDAADSMRAEALLQLGLWGKPPQRDRVVGIYRPLAPRDGKAGAEALAGALPQVLGKSPEAVQLAALEAITSLQMKDAGPQLLGVVADENAPEAVRARALTALDAFESPDVLKAIDAAEKSKAPTLRLAALQVVARRAPERALPIVRRLATEGSQAEQQAAFLSMAQMQGPDKPKLLVAALDQLAAGKVAPGAQLELIEAVEKSDAPTVKAQWAKQQAAWKASGNELASYSFALAGGHPGRGAREFYENQVLPCARCHRINAGGGEAGPDLTTIGARKDAQYLLEAVLKPNKHIAEGFTAPSSMPDIYGQVLTRAQLRDVVAFMKVLTTADTGMNEGGKPRALQSVATEGATGGHN